MRTKALALTLCLVALAMQRVADAQELKPFEASYEWSWHGMTVAVSTLKLEQHPDNWVYTSKSSPRGIGRMFSERPFQQSTLQVTESGVRPLHYKAEDGTSSTKRDADVQFDWKQNRATGVYENNKVDMELQPGIQDDSSIQVALMVDLLAGRTSGRFLLQYDNTVREFRYTRDGQESLDTPAGKVDTVIYRGQKTGSPRITRFWCAPSLGYMPVRIQQSKDDDVQWTMQIKSIKRE